MSSFIQNTIILGGILVLVGLGYYLYTQDGGGENSDVSSQVAAESAAFLSKLNEIKAIELDGSIFADPRFISLLDYSQPVLPEQLGKPNPFDANE